MLPTLRTQHPSPGPRPAPVGSSDPSPVKRPPARLRDSGRVCVTPETWDESWLPSGAPVTGSPTHSSAHSRGLSCRHGLQPQRCSQGLGASERSQVRAGRHMWPVGCGGLSGGPGGRGGEHEAQGPRPILRPYARPPLGRGEASWWGGAVLGPTQPHQVRRPPPSPVPWAMLGSGETEMQPPWGPGLLQSLPKGLLQSGATATKGPASSSPGPPLEGLGCPLHPGPGPPA